MTLEAETERGPFFERAIRTELFTNLEAIPEPWRQMCAPSLSALWLPKRSRSLFGSEYHAIAESGPSAESRSANAHAYVMVLLDNRAFPADFVQNLVTDIQARLKDIMQTSPTRLVVSDLLHENIVIERSPPVSEILINLVHGATSVSLGTILGTGLAHDPYAMLVTVPAGIILMGGALGISRGLERGLSKRIEKAINPSATRRKKDT
jgi:hypothetical protein